MTDLHGMRQIRKSKCHFCKQPTEYHATGGVCWDVCLLHAVISVMNGFTCWDRLGTLMTQEQAIALYSARRDDA